MGHPVIDVTHLRKEYGTGEGKTVALEDVSFSVPTGQFVSIMGPSGSGKSTLLQILGLLDSATSGTYLFDGTSSDAYTQKQLAQIRNEKMGFVFQAFNLLPKTTVYENVALPLMYSTISQAQWRDRILSAIEAVGLSHRTQHQSGMLSGGEKQRCAIARALVTNPAVLFADEPTGNLDSKSGQAVMRILQELHEKQGRTILLITHERATAEHAQRIITIRDGRVESDQMMTSQQLAAAEFTK